MNKVVILPSENGLEIEVALSHGWKEEQIVAIDNTWEVICDSWWVDKYPKIIKSLSNFREGVSAVLSPGEQVCAVNADLCSSFGPALVNEIESFLLNTPMHEDSMVAINTYGPRESHKPLKLELAERYDREHLGPLDSSRLKALFYATPSLKKKYKAVHFEGEYKSKPKGPTLMQYVVLGSKQKEKYACKGFINLKSQSECSLVSHRVSKQKAHLLPS